MRAERRYKIKANGEAILLRLAICILFLAGCTGGPGAGVDENFTSSDLNINPELASLLENSIAPVTPSFGPPEGGTEITIKGSNFLAGATVTLDGEECLDIEIVSPEEIKCTTQPHAEGFVTVIVSNLGGASNTVIANGFLYNEAPVVSSVSPDYGSNVESTAVTITGNFFEFGATVELDGKECTNPVVVSSTTITCNTPERPIGFADVKVINLDTQEGILENGFEYKLVPVVSDISLAAGPIAGGLTVTLNGSNLTNGEISVKLGNTTCGTVTHVTETQITCVTGNNGAAEVVDVVVTNDVLAIFSSLTDSYRYQLPPTVDSISLDGGTKDGGVTVTITTSGGILVGSPTATIDGNACTSPTLTSNTTMTCVTPARGGGAQDDVDVVVTNGETQVSAAAAIYDYLDDPVVDSISLDAGPAAGGQTVTITTSGGRLLGSPTATIDGRACTSPTRLTDTTMTCVVPARPGGAANNVNVVVTNGDGKASAANGIYDYIDPPTVQSISLDGGPSAGGNTVTITTSGGRLFNNPTATIDGNVCTSPTRLTDTTMTCVTPARAGGSQDNVNVIVTNGDGQVSAAAAIYDYIDPPIAASISLDGGTPTGGLTVTITNSGGRLLGSPTATIDGNACTSPSRTSDTTMTCVTPARGGGAQDNVNVVITNGDSQASAAAAIYDYLAVPTVSAINLDGGTSDGGVTVTITTGGGRLIGSPTATIDGNTCTSPTRTSNTTMTCVTPARGGGPQDNVNVVVTNGDTQASAAAAIYDYLAAPVVDSISLDGGPVAGGQTVTITTSGGRLLGSPTATIDGNTCTSPTRLTDTTMTCVTPARGGGAANDVDVVVTNGDGKASAANGIYDYLDPPSVSSISLDAGPTAGGLTVTITTGGGRLFNNPTATIDGNACTSPSRTSDTTMTCVTPARGGGVQADVDVVVTNGDGQVSAAAAIYDYQSAPVISSISLDGGPTAGGLTVTITTTGGRIVGNPTATIDGNACTSPSRTSDTTMTCVTPARGAGVADNVNVVVTNGDTQVSAAAAIYDYIAAPSVSSINLDGGTFDGGVTVTITTGGGRLLGNPTATIDGNTCTSPSRTSDTTMTCVTPARGGGAQDDVDVVVTNGDTQASAASGIYDYLADPVVDSISLDGGPVAGGQTVTITTSGGRLLGNPTATIDGNTCTSPTRLTDTTMTCVTPARGGGVQDNVNVVVTNGDGKASAANAIYDYLAAPVISSISLDAGPPAGGQTVTITTSTRLLGSPTATIDGNTCTSPNRTSNTTMTCVTPARGGGTANDVDVVVTNGDGQTGAAAAIYDYIDPPTVNSISLDGGPTAGGITVTITTSGGKLVGNPTATIDGNTCTSPSRTSDTTMTCVTPARGAGVADNVDVVVTNGDTQVSAAAAIYDYIAAPSVSSIALDGGSKDGGITVTITTGGGRLLGSPTATIDGRACTSPSRTSDTTMTCVTPARPGGAADNVDVVVTNGDTQASSAASIYDYLADVSVDSISFNAGPLAGGQTVTITTSGGRLLGSPTATIDGNTCTSPNRTSDTTMTCVTPSRGSTATNTNVVVTNGDGVASAASALYSYQNGPTVDSISLNAGPVGGGQTVTITISDAIFVGTLAATIDGITCTSPTETSDTTMTCDTGNRVGGAANNLDVVVTNGDGQQGTGSGLYSYQTAPTVDSISLDAGPTGGGQTVTITVSDAKLVGSPTATIGAVTCTSPSITSNTTMTCDTGAKAAGTYDVVVTNGDGQQGTGSNLYQYQGAPSVDTISLDAGPTGGSQTVTITVSSVKLVGNPTATIGAVACTSPTITSNTTMTCVTGAKAAGTYDVVVTNGDTQQGTGSNLFRYQVAPTVDSIALDAGPVGGGQTVTISISNAKLVGSPSATVDGNACTSPTIATDTTMTCVTPARGGGAALDVDVVVTNGDTQVSSAASIYDYQVNPTVVSISPAYGNAAGSTTVTITISNARLIGSPTVAIGGTTCTSPSITSNTTLTCSTGAKSAGTYDVVVTNGDTQQGTLSNGFTYQDDPTVSSITPNVGHTDGGEKIEILGTGFSPTSTVTVGGTTCTSPEFISVTQMSCLTPAKAAAAYDVVVTSDGKTGTLSNGYTYQTTFGTWSANDDADADTPSIREGVPGIWTGVEMVIWGGQDGTGATDTLADGGKYDFVADTWTAITSTGAPSQRKNHTAVWTGQEMLIWGGIHNSAELNDGARYDVALNQWAAITSTGAPVARQYHTAVWTGSKMIIWGGDDSGALNSGALYDPYQDSWASIGTGGDGLPAVRYNHTAIWTGKYMIVWGGYNGSSVLNTGSRYDPVASTWSATDTADGDTAAARHQHTATWTGSKMFIFGGRTCDGIETDCALKTGGTYDPTNNNWAAMAAPAMDARYNHSAVWTGKYVIIWGGIEIGDWWLGDVGGSPTTPTSHNDGEAYDVENDKWRVISTTSAPSKRDNHTAIWTGTKMIIWGGYYDETWYKDSDSFDFGTNQTGDSWLQTSVTSAPSARQEHTTIWTGTKMIVWGGVNSGTYSNTGNLYDPVADSWSAVQTTNAPTARANHTAVWTGTEMIIWGGYDGTNYLQSGAKYDFTADSWSATDTADGDIASVRASHTAVWTGDKMIVWGGEDSSSRLGDGASYDPNADTWAAVATASDPSARKNHTAIWTGSKMIIWGGEDSSTYHNDGALYDAVANSWSAVQSTNAPDGRTNHTAIWTGMDMIIWGGEDGSDYKSDGDLYDPVTNGWSDVQTTNAPTKRASHTAVWTGDHMIIWGGTNGTAQNGGYKYDPVANAWADASTTNAPSGRTAHTAIYTGYVGPSNGSGYRYNVNSNGDIGRMIIWGGNDGSSTAQSGGIYQP